MLGHYVDMNLTSLAYGCVKRGEAATCLGCSLKGSDSLDFHREYRCNETSAAAVVQPEDPLTVDL